MCARPLHASSPMLARACCAQSAVSVSASQLWRSLRSTQLTARASCEGLGACSACRPEEGARGRVRISMSSNAKAAHIGTGHQRWETAKAANLLTGSRVRTSQHSVLRNGERGSAQGPLHQALHAQLQRVRMRRERAVAASGSRPPTSTKPGSSTWCSTVRHLHGAFGRWSPPLPPTTVDVQ